MSRGGCKLKNKIICFGLNIDVLHETVIPTIQLLLQLSLGVRGKRQSNFKSVQFKLIYPLTADCTYLYNITYCNWTHEEISIDLSKRILNRMHN